MADRDSTGSAAVAANAADRAVERGPTFASALTAAVMKRIELPSFTAASGSAAAVHVGEVRLENASVDRVDIHGVTTTFSTGAISLDNARAIVAIRVFVEWWYDLWFASDSGTTTLGTFDFPFEIGDINVPSLSNIGLEVRNASLRDVIAAIHPVRDLDLGGATFSALGADDTLLPSAGFGVGGLRLGAVNLTDVRLPGARTSRVTLGAFTPNAPLVLPSLRIDGVEIPAASAPRVSSEGLIAVRQAVASERVLPGLNLGIFGFRLGMQPTLDIFIDALTIHDFSASAAIERVDLRDVRASVALRDLELSRVNLEQLQVDRLAL